MSKERVISLGVDPFIKKGKRTLLNPTSLITVPYHGQSGRRMVSKSGRKEYVLVWYHDKFGWINRQKAWTIWQKISCEERQRFPKIDWWP